MKNAQRIIAIAIFTVFIIAVIGSIIMGIVGRHQDNLTPSISSTPAAPSALDLYAQAADAVSAATELTLSVTESTTTTLDNGVFSQQAKRSIQYTGLGTENMSALASETISIGNYDISYSQYYHDGRVYLTIGGGKFCSPVSGADFYKENIPVVLLDAERYHNVEASQSDDGTTIEFHSPKSAEIWAFPEGAVFLDASGLATLDSNLQLTTSAYDISYSIGSAQVNKHIQISIKTDPVSFVPPATESFLEIQHPEAPIILEKACGYLMHAQSVTANIQDTIICDAFGDDRKQTISLDMHGEDSKFMAKVDLSVLLVNSSRGGEQLRRTENILYRDGRCSVTVDGVSYPDDMTITAHDIHINLQDLLLSTILLPQYIAGVSVTESEDVYRYDFSAVPALAETMCQNACQTLYKDADLLINLSDESATTSLGAYLQIQKDTGLPAASGIFYTGNYTIDGHSYMLKYETDQTYSPASGTAYHSIAG